MNAQEIFDTVATHLFAQGHRAVNGMAYCMYRAPDGSKCAVGCMLPDEFYVPDMENKTIGQLVKGFQLPEWMSEHRKLLDRLQGAHDDELSWDSTEAMRDALTDAVPDFELDLFILQTLSFAGR